ncbi:MAG TPA: patatin-like phospholipase family protein [Burkholderiales bacterium]|nr:patatin-like phospholipase family protein [Burkholderiales bacterium]
MQPPKVVLVLSGGLALGAYQAGAYAALHAHGTRPEHLAGVSIGAVNAALIAGGEPRDEVERLRAFWDAARLEPLSSPADWMLADTGPWRYGRNWLSVLQARALGNAAVFRPTLGSATAIYDLAPLRATMERLVDFRRLNDGAMRIAVLATDLDAGVEVVFDTGKGERIGLEHVLASCGFLPEFPPVEIDGRLLGDGGLTANAPVEPALLGHGGGRDVLCFVVDLFPADGPRPATLEQAAARRVDLLLGAQTRQALRRLEREHRLRPDGERPRVKILHLRHRAGPREAAPEKHFDFSRATLAERWEAGCLDMAEAIALAAGDGHPQTRGSRGVLLSSWS